MRVSILTVGSRGDVQPFAAFGTGLQRAGHEVRICAHPEFRELVTGQGLEFAPLAEGALSRGTETELGRRWASSATRTPSRMNGCATRLPAAATPR
jgi:UDP:flavonoid glycosyltransferase YjiC (YdhE family)